VLIITNMTKKSKPLILAPVNDFTSLKAAIDAGADEIYFGIRGFNMRATAKNFSVNDLKKVVKICHEYNVKALLALNTIIYEPETKIARSIIRRAKDAGIDAIVAWDMSIIQECIRQNISVHLSTQNSISNYEALKFYKKHIPTLKRVVLARECSLEDIKNIILNIKKDRLKIQIETFIHGAMCVSVSGRCMLSHHLFGKSANRGECLQPCRRNYKAYKTSSLDKEYFVKSTDKLDLDNEFLLGENCVISPKDLCTLPFIEKLVDAGIDVFKIEGRNRNPEYIFTTVKAYKDVVEYYLHNKLSISKSKKIRSEYAWFKDKNLNKLKTVFNRGFSGGFYLGKPVDEWSSSRTGEQTTMKLYVGRVTNYYPKVNVAEITIEDHPINMNDLLIIQGPTTGNYDVKVLDIKDDKGSIDKAVKGMIIGIKVGVKVRKNDQVYNIVDKS
jgi:U32 family peptidase